MEKTLDKEVLWQEITKLITSKVPWERYVESTLKHYGEFAKRVEEKEREEMESWRSAINAWVK